MLFRSTKRMSMGPHLHSAGGRGAVSLGAPPRTPPKQGREGWGLKDCTGESPLLSSRDGYLLEPTAWRKGSEASYGLACQSSPGHSRNQGWGYRSSLHDPQSLSPHPSLPCFGGVLGGAPRLTAPLPPAECKCARSPSQRAWRPDFPGAARAPGSQASPRGEAKDCALL